MLKCIGPESDALGRHRASIAKSNIGGYFETIGERTDPTLHIGVIVQHIPVKITKLQGILLQGEASKRGGNIGLYQGGSFESDQTLKALDEKNHVPVINFFSYRNNFSFSMSFIEIGLK